MRNRRRRVRDSGDQTRGGGLTIPTFNYRVLVAGREGCLWHGECRRLCASADGGASTMTGMQAGICRYDGADRMSIQREGGERECRLYSVLFA